MCDLELVEISYCQQEARNPEESAAAVAEYGADANAR